MGDRYCGGEVGVTVSRIQYDVSTYTYARFYHPFSFSIIYAAKQVLVLATEPRPKREARSVLCHICH